MLALGDQSELRFNFVKRRGDGTLCTYARHTLG